ncbi:hypothetical protein H6P81_006687 [Aristolochia fimbriata]|uniref:Uncharacterized protein n=1 Tax=Aristolochia fimbriata TaxID=158543 RepID=A0AAV7F2J3_ARIFI|nr:hypothetical protein H6P81_006687 [Aristolochia fimbriata]
MGALRKRFSNPVGDQLSLSLKNLVFYTLKKVGVGEEEEEHERKRVREVVQRSEMETLEGEETRRAAGLYGGETTGSVDLEVVSIDLSQIDLVKDFDFLWKGEEFNHYPKQKIPDIANWNWFINDTNGSGEDDDARSPKGRKHERRKDKKIDDDEDEDWTGESEVDMASVKKMRNPKRSKYCVTRSRDRKKAFKANGEKSSEQKTMHLDNEEEEQERGEDDEETLGGFIVSDVEEPEEVEAETLDEEEEFDDEDGESDDDDETRRGGI